MKFRYEDDREKFSVLSQNTNEDLASKRFQYAERK